MNRHDQPQHSAADDAVRRLIMGFRATQLVHVAAKLGIADQLSQGPQDAAALASAVGGNPGALHRLLRALASLGIVAPADQNRFQLTPLGETLRSDVPGSLRPIAILYGDEWLWQVYGQTFHSVATGQPAFARVHGQTIYEYLQGHPSAAETFDRAMTAYSDQEAAAILSAYDFSSASQVVDVGGGQGALLAAILRAHPQTSGVLLDRRAVLDRARHTMDQAGVGDRCTLLAGDFFAAVPAGGSVYVLKNVLHNWDDSETTAILRACRRAMSANSRLLIVERILPDDDAPSDAALFDINMMVVTGGLERTPSEHKRLLAEAGFELTGIVPASSSLSVLESVPA